ncbi:MAG: Ig-like domain-containing protein, partial [Gemmatimonadaceae bacterium]
MHLTDPLRLFAIATGILAITACVDSMSSPTELHSPSPDASRVKWVVVSPATAAIRSGAKVTLDVQFQDESREQLDVAPAQWKSSDTTVAVVSDKGVVTGRKPGRAKILVSSAAQGAYAEVQVTAAPPPTVSVSVSPTSVTLAAAATKQLSATVKLSSGGTVSKP